MRVTNHAARTGRRAAVVLAVGLAAVIVLSLGQSVLGLDRPDEALPDEKQALLEREDRLRRETPVRPKPAAPNIKGPAIPVDAEWPTGIYHDGEFPSADYRFVNRWTGTIGGRHVTVYAGSYAADAARGLVLVMSVSVDLKDVQAREYPTPGAGPVRILAVRGTGLTLVHSDGAHVAFDVVSRRFALG
jgi:hypothetical protein